MNVAIKILWLQIQIVGVGCSFNAMVSTTPIIFTFLYWYLVSEFGNNQFIIGEKLFQIEDNLFRTVNDQFQNGTKQFELEQGRCQVFGIFFK